MRRREFQRNPARPRQANKDMPGHAQEAQTGKDSPRERQRNPECETGPDRHKETRRGTATPIEVRRSPGKPGKTQQAQTLRQALEAQKGQTGSPRGAQIIEERPREAQRPPDRQKQTETNPDNQREAWGCLREAQRCSESWRGPGRPRDV